ncbi:MAG: LysM peptidoglycan-binding domain-containing protein [Prevotellaceae bacterium]|jgi:membrane-bound lytic murein transglycosylase D|nr:LysM peptidoglycan-binding domain-containing protein [Prevotellaceae bacterium]
MKYLLSIIIQLAVCLAITAQINDKALFRSSDQEAGKNPNGKADSSPTIWYLHKALHDTSGIVLYDEEDVPAADMPDSVYIRRLNNISSTMSLPYNVIVRNHIVYYMQKISYRLEIILGLSEYYLPIFEQILDIYDIPLEIRALPIIESALNPIAVSRVGATGMWQFMLQTGRQYGLTISTLVDERRDPIASAHAAARFLTDLYNRYNDWTLALAAYNCGAGNVDKAIARANGKRDYWEIYPYLPKETRNYVPAFVAANYALRYHKEHRLTPKSISLPAQIDTFMISTNLHLAQISKVINIPIEELRELNPQYKKDIIPGIERPYELRIPSEYMEAFVINEQRIYSGDSEHFDKNIVKIPASAGNTAGRKTATNGSGQQTYTVKAGESLTMIAQKNGVKLTDLCAWNKIKTNSTIHPGQKLVIYKSGAPANSDNTAKPSAKQENKEQNNNTVKTSAAPEKTEKAKYHIVKDGESLWTIAQKYEGVSFNNLLKANGMTNKSKIIAGQKLILP